MSLYPKVGPNMSGMGGAKLLVCVAFNYTPQP